jgi:hypothetical protein
MKKTVIFVLSVIFLALANMACESQKTTQEYLREEKKAIERYIDRQGITILKDYPKDHKFGAKEYYRTNEGLYIHVVDSGNGVKVKPFVDEVQVRFDYLYYVKTYVSGDTASIPFDNIGPYYGEYPFSFIYGQSASYTNLACDGWALPLSYITEGAIINLIITSSLGAEYDNSYQNFNAVFYKNLIYTSFY